jgi:hypothetical protein
VGRSWRADILRGGPSIHVSARCILANGQFFDTLRLVPDHCGFVKTSQTDKRSARRLPLARPNLNRI